MSNKVTAHAFGTVHKPKITVHGQWTMPDVRPGKKKHKKRNARNAIPKRDVSVLIASTNLCRIQSFFLYLFFNYSNLVHSKNLQFEMIMESRN